MSKDARKYRRLSKNKKIVDFKINKSSPYSDLYFYSNEYVGDFESKGEVAIKYRINASDNICFNNHEVFGQLIFPTDAYLEMIAVACKTYFNIDSMMFNNIIIANPLVGDTALTNDITLVFQKNGGDLRFSVHSNYKSQVDGSGGIIHIRGNLHPITKYSNKPVKYYPSLRIGGARQVLIDDYYSSDSNIVLGEFYNALKTLTFGREQSVGKIESDIPENKFLLNPSVVSAALANAMSYGPHRLGEDNDIANDLFLPYKINNLFVCGPILGKSFTSLAEVKDFNENWVEVYLEIVDENNNAVLVVDTLRLQRVNADNYKNSKAKFATKKKIPLSPSAGLTSTNLNGKNLQCEDIAVIGMSCRFPKSKNVEEFWDILKSGHDCIIEVPEDRWQEFDHWYHPDPNNQHTSYSKWGGFIDDIDKFDPLFFNISPSEAELMDPQQRIFLEEAWRTIESAGYSTESLSARNCGIFVGCTVGDYERLLAMSGEDTNGQSFMGTSSAILAARISYLLNLKGPSLSVDTACSSSLTAIHLACMSIRTGESDLAIAGGVSIFSTPLAHILTSRVRMQSTDGRCFTFDKSANGTVFSEGCGVVMLKPLIQAEKDSDNIIGVIKGSGVNQDGKTNGITAPSARSQESLLRSIYQRYKINPDDITYVEAHGTATPLGDPIEFQALKNAFQNVTKRNQYCAIGSVKSNIGHGSYAAGVAGMIKTLLCLKHNKYVPSVHFKEANNIIDFDHSPFFVSTDYKYWPEPKHGKRMAAVSSFGFSGANAHIVLEEYKIQDSRYKNDRHVLNVASQNSAPVIIPLSAKNKDRLMDVAINLSNYLKACLSNSASDMPKLYEVAYTLQVGRDSMDERVVFVIHSISDLLEKLDKYIGKKININGCYQGNIKSGNKIISRFKDNPDAEKLLINWIKKGVTEEYLDLWVNGIRVDWNILYKQEKPNKVILPTYPFSKERYWVSAPITKKSEVNSGKVPSSIVMHPLVQFNDSDIFSQIYYSVFDGSEYFFKKNTTHNIAVMGNMVFLEMARIAIIAALGDAYKNINIELDNTKWFSDVVVEEEPIKLFIDLYEIKFDENNNFKSVNYNIFSMENDSPEKIIHVQGVGSLGLQSPVENININNILEDINGSTLNPEQCDEVYELLNIDCVPGDLGLKKVFFGDGQAVVRHCLPDYSLEDDVDYVLHPVPMTLVSKTAIAIIKGVSNVIEKEVKKGENRERLHSDLFLLADSHPVSVKKIKIFSSLGGIMHSWVRYTKGGSSSGTTFKVDISVYDEAGNVCIEIIGYEVEVYLSDNSKNYSDHDRPKKMLSIVDNRQCDVFEDVFDQLDISPIKNNGVYLIACDCEKMGVLLVEYLSQWGAAKIFLVICSEKIDSFKGKLETIETLDVDIQYINHDLLQLSYVKSCLVNTNHLAHKINGIFYAGTISDCSVNNSSEVECEFSRSVEVFNKVYANPVPEQEYPDFICDFLSGKNIIKQQSVGSDNHVICRTVKVTGLDGFQEKNTICGKSLVVDWKAESGDRQNKTLHKNGGFLYSNREFIAKVFGLAFVQYDTHSFVIADKGLSSLQCHFISESQAGDCQGINNDGNFNNTIFNHPSFAQKKNIQLSASEIGVYIEADLKKIIHEQLKINYGLLDVDTNFSEFGFDSIGLTEFAHRLSQCFDIEVLPAVLFGNYTLEKLATYLLSEHNDEIIKYYREQQEVAPHKKKSPSSLKEGNKAPDNIRSLIKQGCLVKNNEPLSRRAEITGENPEKKSCSERVAVIGISGKFPMADTLDDFWNNLESGKDCITRVPVDRWGSKNDFTSSQKSQHKPHMTWGGFINGVAEFDPDFFGISHREAELMDPQQRLLMIYVYRAIEDAGYSPKRIAEKNIAVFIGTENSGYDSLVEKSGSEIEAYTATGTQPSVGPNRISFYLDLRGPSEPIETACASSLVAIRRGMMALNEGCEMAIVGGVNTLLSPARHIAYDKAGMLSEDGRCKTFSTDADGFVRSEGVGILLLKKLSRAEEEGDHVYGLLCGSAESHGGRAHSLTTPNPIAQTQLLEKVYKEANIDPRTVTYIETHGTGTQLGDSIEIDGLKTAFRSLITGIKHHSPSNDTGTSLSANAYCGIGSVKTNIGHTELASGVIGVIKVLLQLKHAMLVKSIHTTPLSPYLQLEGSPFFVVQDGQKWQALSDDSGVPIPRRAGISSFGMGGVNAHVILEEYIPRQKKISATTPAQLVIFSARNKKQLDLLVKQMLDYVIKNEELSLDNFAYTLQVGRDQMDARLAMIVSDRESLITGIKNYLGVNDSVYPSAPLIFSGESQRNSVDRCFVNDLFQEKNLEKLGEYWVEGGSIPWDLLHKGKILNRIPLPTYPFDKKHYWISKAGLPRREILETPEIKGAQVEENEWIAMGKASRSPLFESWFFCN